MVKTLIWAYFIASAVLAQDNCDNIIAVQRRSQDILYTDTATSNATDCQDKSYICNGSETYLVAEQRCANFPNGKNIIIMVKVMMVIYSLLLVLNRMLICNKLNWRVSTGKTYHQWNFKFRIIQWQYNIRC